MERPQIGDTRTVLRWAILPYPHRIAVTEQYSDAPGEPMFFPEIRWRVIRRERLT